MARPADAIQTFRAWLEPTRGHPDGPCRPEQVVKLLGFVASVDGFTRQPWVMNGASELLIKLFGERGKHARAAIGTNQLPLDIPVEVEIVVRVRN